MNVLVDTSVWSLALRRSEPDDSPPLRELHELILEGRAQIIGPVRQEVLSAIRATIQFRKLRDALRAFPDIEVASGDFERAAELFKSVPKTRNSRLQHRFPDLCGG